MKKEKRIYILQVRITELEDETIKKEAEKLGFKNNKSEYLRSKILRKNTTSIDPEKIFTDIRVLRNELNKIGLKLNQVANHTNLLLRNNIVDHKHIKELKEIELGIENNVYELKKTIDKTIDKTL